MNQTKVTLHGLLEQALVATGELSTGREAALVRTKLQEAQYWLAQHQHMINIKVKERTGSMKSYATRED
jgi:hypothetical protein